MPSLAIVTCLETIASPDTYVGHLLASNFLTSLSCSLGMLAAVTVPCHYLPLLPCLETITSPDTYVGHLLASTVHNIDSPLQG
jgi:hypothetical protein